MNKRITNKAEIFGEVTSVIFDHCVYGEKFYRLEVSVKRLSGVIDTVPVIASEYLMEDLVALPAQFACIKGRWNSRMQGGHLDLFLLATNIEVIADELENQECKNELYLDGNLCKDPIYRITPQGRRIADMLLAVNHPYGNSVYLPCICWGSNAEDAKLLQTGAHLRIKGRIQSRPYVKRYENGTEEDKVAYEVSVCEMEVVEEGIEITEDNKEN